MIASMLLAAVALAGPSAQGMQECKSEDGSHRADRNGCVWDGRHAGNGTGKSYIVRANGSVVYITHRRAHNLTGRS